MADKYTYPNTDVLKNKCGVKDTLLLHALERKYVTARITQLRTTSTAGNFDFKHLKKIHEHLFQDVYTWAGKIREIDIGKVDELNTQQMTEFCPVHRIEGFQEDIFKALKKENYLTGRDNDTFARQAAAVMGEINLLHPFREGNGRTQREFMRELALHAGWELDFDGVSKGRMTEASIASIHMDNRGLEDIIKESLRPISALQSREYEERMSTIAAAPAVKELVKNPQSADLFCAYAKEALGMSTTWDNKMDTIIAANMIKNKVSAVRIEAALKHSPSMIGRSNIDRMIKTRTIMKEARTQSPELKSPGYTL